MRTATSSRCGAACHANLHILLRDVPNVDLPPPLKADVLHGLSRKEVLWVTAAKELVLKGEREGVRRERMENRKLKEKDRQQRNAKGVCKYRHIALLQNIFSTLTTVSWDVHTFQRVKM